MERNSLTWVLVADGSNARFFEVGGHGEPLKEVRHEQASRDQTRNIVSDRQGRRSSADRTGHHAMDAQTNPQRHAEHEFARHLCRILDDEAASGSYDRLVLAAAPRTLGDLRDMLSSNVRKKVEAEFDKDLIHTSPRDLAHYLSDKIKH